MNPPLISIVLPTYNGSRFLADSVESVRRQTYPHWELLLQDDCSTDATPDLIARLAASDARIKPARNASNLRLPLSLNAGFVRASGSFLTWTSDDNEYHPEALESMLAVLRSDPALGLVYCDMTDIDDEGRVLGLWSAPEPADLGLVNAVGACFLYRRSVREAVGDYDDRWWLVEDWEYWMRVASRFPIQALHRALYLYRRHAASLTATRTAEIQRMRMEMLAARLPELGNLPRRRRAEAYLRLARTAAEFGNRSRSAEFNRKARELDPVRSTLVIAGRNLIGARRAGALRQRLRRWIGGPTA